MSAIDGIGKVSSFREDRLPEGSARARRLERAAHQLVDVGAGAKGSVAGARDQHGAGIAGRDLIESSPEIAQQFKIQRVQNLRAVEPDERELIDARQMDRHRALAVRFWPCGRGHRLSRSCLSVII
jgi:hypothetical protein